MTPVDQAKKSGVCIHGGLRRKCETCDLADDLDASMKENEVLRTENEWLKKKLEEFGRIIISLQTQVFDHEAVEGELNDRVEALKHYADFKAWPSAGDGGECSWCGFGHAIASAALSGPGAKGSKGEE